MDFGVVIPIKEKSTHKLAQLANRYRLQAEEVRTVAEIDGCARRRAMLVSIAASYDLMADTPDTLQRSYSLSLKRYN